MVSTPKDRLFLVYQAYRGALEARRTDLKDAQTEGQVAAIIAHVEALEASYFDCAKAVLDVDGPDVEAAYAAAVGANTRANAAREGAESIQERIAATATTVTAVANLMAVAGGNMKAAG